MRDSESAGKPAQNLSAGLAFWVSYSSLSERGETCNFAEMKEAATKGYTNCRWTYLAKSIENSTALIRCSIKVDFFSRLSTHTTIITAIFRFEKYWCHFVGLQQSRNTCFFFYFANCNLNTSACVQVGQGAVIFSSLVRVWASRDTTLLRTIFRAVSEQFFKIYLYLIIAIVIILNNYFNFGIILYWFNGLFLEYGNFWFVSARLSLKKHYPFTYYFQSSFRAVLEQFFVLIYILLLTLLLYQKINLIFV